MITPGARLGPYEIVSRIGAGGMGEVWRAKDARLEREVAIKILPAEFAENAQLKLRFEREAKTISQLNHPHICVLHDVGEARLEAGDSRLADDPLSPSLSYLVMELLEGESLAERLAKGSLPLAEVLKFGAQLAEALDRAHRAGVVHRDLKPGNVMITKSGAKLLDFGLAKSETPGTLRIGTSRPPAGSENDATAFKPQQPLTQEGTILGTFQYMAPEQLEGVEADPRTDLFALGAVLYEMATGTRAFEGKTKTSLIAQIVGGEPRPIRELQPLTPPALEHVIAKCLEKDPDDRWQSAHDVAEELRWISEAGSQAGIAAPAVKRRKIREQAAWTIAVAMLLLGSVMTALYLRTDRGLEQREPIRLSIVGADGKAYSYSPHSQGPVISPDGRKIVFVAAGSDGRDLLFLRLLNGLGEQPLSGTEGASYPFWSSDSRHIGFFSGGKLKKIEATGGPVSVLANARSGRGGSWNRENVIIFTPDISGPIYRVSANGGEPSAVTDLENAPGDMSHRWPSFLPDGKRFLYLAASGTGGMKDEVNAVWVTSVQSDAKAKRLVTGQSRALFANGFLLFVRDSFLLAQELDPDTLEMKGEPLPIAEDVRHRVDVWGSSYFSVSETGILLFQGGSAANLNLVLVDREGNELGTIGAPSNHQHIRISPDGRRVASSVVDPASGTSDVWIYEFDRDVGRRMTFESNNEVSPLFSPDGSRIVFGSNGKGEGKLVVRAVTGAISEELLLSSNRWIEPHDWSLDGRYILVNQSGKKMDLFALPLFGERKPFPLVAGDAEEGWGRISPDGKWVVYLSNETSQWEMFALRFPPDNRATKWQLTTTGADWLVGWRSDGREIYYLDLAGNMMAMPVSAGEEIEPAAPATLFRVGGNLTWAAMPDGSRFVIGREPAGIAEVPTTAVIDWVPGVHN